MTNDVESVLKDNPTLLKIMKCWNLVNYYRSNQTNLTEFLKRSDNFSNLILLLHKSKDKNVVKVVLSLFVSSNTSLLREFAVSKENTIKLLSFLSKKKKPPPFSIAACFSIMSTAFMEWPTDMFSIINNSIEIALNLINNVDKLVIENFLLGVINRYSSSQTFLWFAYRVVMENYGPGGPTPAIIANESAVMNAIKVPNISQQQKIVIYRLLSTFFGKYTVEGSDFSKIILRALPVMIQKSNSDDERSKIFELALTLGKCEAMGKCAYSILFSNCKNPRLIELSFQYLTKYPPKPNPNDLELLMYDILNAKHTEFLIVSFLSFFRTQLLFMEMTKQFVERARNIVIYSMRNQTSTLLIRSLRVDMINAINGKNTLSNTCDFSKDINKQRNNSCSSSYDRDRIRVLKIQLTNISNRLPIYNAMSLWGERATINKSFFPGIENAHINNYISSYSRSTSNFNQSIDINDYLSDDSDETPISLSSINRNKFRSPSHLVKSTSDLSPRSKQIKIQSNTNFNSKSKSNNKDDEIPLAVARKKVTRRKNKESKSIGIMDSIEKIRIPPSLPVPSQTKKPSENVRSDSKTVTLSKTLIQTRTKAINNDVALDHGSSGSKNSSENGSNDSSKETRMSLLRSRNRSLGVFNVTNQNNDNPDQKFKLNDFGIRRSRSTKNNLPFIDTINHFNAEF